MNDLAQVTIGHAPRLGQFGLHEAGRSRGRRHPDARGRAGAGDSEPRRGDDQGPERARAAARRESRPFYDRQGLIEETTNTVEANLLRGMLLVLVILGLFLFSVRTALIVAVTIPFALLFSFICLDWRHIPANLLSIGAIDFGIIVDGAVVMVENIFRELAAREERTTTCWT